MLKVYSNAGMSKQHIGTCENGKVYREEAFGRTEIGSYENGNVYSGVGYMKKRVGGYDERTIYQNGFFDEAVGEVDSNGNSFDGTGLFKDVTGKKISNVGAVAAAQLLFPGCYYEEEGTNNINGVSEGNSGSAASTNDYSATSVFFSILGAIFIAVWKFIKTIPFWGPYGSILLLPFLMTARTSGNSSSGGTGGVAVVFGLAYLVLHTILLFKCKKWNVKHKYWPIYGEFGLLVLGTFLGGPRSMLLGGILVVIFQVGVLIYMKQKTQDKAKPLCQGCGKQLQTNAKYCPSCGKLAKNEQGNENVTAPISESSKESGARKKLPLFIILPVAVILLLSIFHVIQYSGYKSFVKEYFSAVETGDMDEITQFYSWDYVETKNEKNKSNHATQFFVWDSLEYYIDSSDKYYRWFAGEEIEHIEITGTDKNLLSSTPQIEVEAYIVFEGHSDDVVVYIDMERGSEGWYMTRTDAYYASDEAED